MAVEQSAAEASDGELSGLRRSFDTLTPEGRDQIPADLLERADTLEHAGA